MRGVGGLRVCRAPLSDVRCIPDEFLADAEIAQKILILNAFFL